VMLPTGVRLLQRALEVLVRLAKRRGVELSQPRPEKSDVRLN
jgi:hypothetical protein